MKYRRIRMFWYDHRSRVLVTVAMLLALGSMYFMLSVDCSTGGSCTLASSGLADSVLGPRTPQK